jgi:hypothetical protein
MWRGLRCCGSSDTQSACLARRLHDDHCRGRRLWCDAYCSATSSRGAVWVNNSESIAVAERREAANTGGVIHGG